MKVKCFIQMFKDKKPVIERLLESLSVFVIVSCGLLVGFLLLQDHFNNPDKKLPESCQKVHIGDNDVDFCFVSHGGRK